jgi:putative redox protein
LRSLQPHNFEPQESRVPVESVSAQWIENQVFLLRDRNDFPLVMTQPGGVNGADLLPLSLIGCVAWDVVSILKKMHKSIDSLVITAESERESEPPWRFTRITITYRLRGDNLKETDVRRAIELAEKKYCSIYATLQPVVELRSEIEIETTG